MKNFVKPGVVALVMAFAAFGGSAVSAATCSASISNNVTTNAGCETGTTNNDTLGSPPLQVNIDTMFGIDDWEFLAKDNSLNGVDEGANPLGLVLTGGALSGTWSISANAFDLYESLMLVVKGANPNNYVGYLLDSVSGTYTTVFFKTNSKGKVSSQDISHVSLYGVVAAVPVPAAGLLLLGALGGLAALRRRRAAV